MAQKVGEYLTEKASWVQDHIQLRVRQPDYFAYEEIDLVKGLGGVALVAVGAHSGRRNETPRTVHGEVVRVDENHPITQIALSVGSSVKAAHDLVMAMDGGNTGWTLEKHRVIEASRDDAAYRLGKRILTYLSQNK